MEDEYKMIWTAPILLYSVVYNGSHYGYDIWCYDTDTWVPWRPYHGLGYCNRNVIWKRVGAGHFDYMLAALILVGSVGDMVGLHIMVATFGAMI